MGKKSTLSYKNREKNMNFTEHKLNFLNGMKIISFSQLLIVMIQLSTFLFLFIGNSSAELKPMSNYQMKTATAQAGFTEFNMNNSTARLFLDIHMETYATINSFSAGYYNGGWEQQWNDVRIGNSNSSPLEIDGLVFITDFKDGSFDQGATPELERIIIGSNRLQGSISGLLNSFTGIYSSALTGGGSPDTILNRENLAGTTGTDRTTFDFDSNSSLSGDRGLFLILNISNGSIGFQAVAGYNETNIPASPAGGPWWDSP